MDLEFAAIQMFKEQRVLHSRTGKASQRLNRDDWYRGQLEDAFFVLLDGRLVTLGSIQPITIEAIRPTIVPTFVKQSPNQIRQVQVTVPWDKLQYAW